MIVFATLDSSECILAATVGDKSFAITLVLLKLDRLLSFINYTVRSYSFHCMHEAELQLPMFITIQVSRPCTMNHTGVNHIIYTCFLTVLYNYSIHYSINATT